MVIDRYFRKKVRIINRFEIFSYAKMTIIIYFSKFILRNIIKHITYILLIFIFCFKKIIINVTFKQYFKKKLYYIYRKNRKFC